MTEQQKDFVHMYLKHRDKIVAHNLAYGNNSNFASVESSANRLLRIPEIADTIRSIQDNIRHEVEEEFKAKYREELLTIYDKRLLLKKIATGEIYIEQKYKGKNCTQCSQYISPTYHMMMQALKEDSKLAGHYPHKQNGKWVIPALQTETEQEEIISTLEKGNKGQQSEKSTVDYQPSIENNTDSFSLPFRGIGGKLEPDETPSEKGNKGQQLEVLSPAGGGVSLSADGGGTLALDESDEKKNNGQHPDRYLDEEIFTPELKESTLENTSPSGLVGEFPQDAPPEKDNKTEQTEEPTIDNQPITEDLKTHDILTVNTAGNIISQENLRQLLYPQKPKLSYMKNNH